MNLPTTDSAQAYLSDPRNDTVLVYVNGRFVPRAEAVVSIFDAGFGLGDGVWEGLRLANGRIISLSAHLDRLYEGACSIAIDIGLTRQQMTNAITETLARNGRPTRILRVASIGEESMGALMMHFMLETIIAADLLGVDPFDQPKVEEGKVLARKYLAAMGPAVPATAPAVLAGAKPA